MPSSRVQTFTEPAEYAAAIRAVSCEMVVTARGQFAAKLTRIDLHDLWMQRFSEDLPRVAHTAAGTGRAIIGFRTQAGPSLLHGGIEVQPSAIVRYGNEHDLFQCSSGPLTWGAMSLPIEKCVPIAAAVTGCDITPRAAQLSVTPSAVAMGKLQRLHAAAGSLAEDASEIITNSGAAHGLEQALILAMVACLDTSEAVENRSSHRRHETIMRRFHAAIAERPEDALYIPDLCAAVGVPQRTLNLCCQESLGMGPKRYLLLRRMALARQALREADAARTTVTDVASRFGFWNFGRFAVEYRTLYGETPSATLHSAPP